MVAAADGESIIKGSGRRGPAARHAKSHKAANGTMGIRFRCPNGHKLNVKSFLAGKRGVCPDCGQTFRIPPDGTDDGDVVAMPLESRRNGSPRLEEDNLAESDFETAVAVAAAAVSEPTKAAVEGVVFLPPMPTHAAPAPQARAGQAGPSQSPPSQSPAPQVVSPQARGSEAPAPTLPTERSANPPSQALEIFFPGPVNSQSISPTPPRPGIRQPASPVPLPASAPPPPPAPPTRSWRRLKLCGTCALLAAGNMVRPRAM